MNLQTKETLLKNLAETLKCTEKLSDIYSIEPSTKDGFILVKYMSQPDILIYVGDIHDDLAIIREIIEYFTVQYSATEV